MFSDRSRYWGFGVMFLDSLELMFVSGFRG